MRQQNVVSASSLDLCGLPLFWVEDPAWRYRWGGLSVLCLGGFALALACSAVEVGSIRLQYSVIKRSTRPRTYWATLALLVVTGAGVVAGAIWLAFLKL